MADRSGCAALRREAMAVIWLATVRAFYALSGMRFCLADLSFQRHNIVLFIVYCLLFVVVVVVYSFSWGILCRQWSRITFRIFCC